ncbi:uncharacterized protein LAESUDRAFT_761368 [Laetiporus sulphureus 93-53]|uniref:Uncharacterized protein n=1 Tax=Laetiporus sulphureus 93-53 TaxID=1314785 RepID=A0A165D2C6_9APHY|nr:uncharacterized protein LAESUDRAFT_761368 [Laetiporus sulphureus 93-53]KZT04014.1 hypothetical protein LAESUDRAFT_761368 [Laetiporus sulphureus 93-53]
MSSVQTSRARVLIAPVLYVDGASPPPYQSVDTWPANGQAPLRRRSPSTLTCTPLQPLSPLPVSSAGSPTHPTFTRPRSRTAGDSSIRPRRTSIRPRSRTHTEMSMPDSSPPPYSPSPVQRASSSPHLRGTPPLQLFTYSHPPSSSSLASQSLHHRPPSYSPATRSADTSGEDADDTATSDDGMIFTVPPLGMSGSLRLRLLKRKTRTHDGQPARPISTSHGVPGAGETETESEDSVSVDFAFSICRQSQVWRGRFLL